MPWSAVLAVSGLLVGAACLMASQSLALAADGSWQLVRVLASEDVWGLDERILGAWLHQAAVVVAVRAGVTDTHALSMLLGVGHFLVPAVAWSLAIVLARKDRFVCFAVAMIAGLSSGATWFISVNEVVLAAPLTVLVAVLLWQPGPWRWRDLVLAIAASAVLVACYETAVLTGSVLAAWAVWRAVRGGGPSLDRLGCAVVAGLSFLSVVVAVYGTRAGANPSHSQSFLYHVVSLEPWPFYVALAGIATFVTAFAMWRAGPAPRVGVALASLALVVAIAGFEPSPFTGLQVRGGVALASLALEAVLFGLWIGRRRVSDSEPAGHSPRIERGVATALTVLPVVFVASMVAVNLQPLREWSQSLDAFRSDVDRSDGVVLAVDVLPDGQHAVLWGWTASSLSLLLRSGPTGGVLVDRDPSLIPFPPGDARSQLPDEYTWGG